MIKDFFKAEIDIVNVEEENVSLERGLIEAKDIKQAKFNKCLFGESKFRNVIFDKVIFNKCDLSNVIFENCGFHQVEFNECKLLGASFNEHCLIKNSIISESVCIYINFVDTKFSKTKIKNCNFENSTFINTKFLITEIYNLNLGKSRFINTSLNKIDISSSQIDGVIISPDDVKGCIISHYQAMILASMLGVIIKD